MGAFRFLLALIILCVGSYQAEAQFYYGPQRGGPVFRPLGPPVPNFRPPVQNFVQQYRYAPAPVQQAPMNFLRSPTIPNAARQGGIILFYPNTAN
jgi:hypothetical protein